jgi:long-chain acyl-CoA synthetase
MLVQHLLETSSDIWPDKVALVCGKRRVTYRELDTQANRLAHALREAGVERGDRVTILLESSPEAVIAIFAALKAGGVFMVLHPSTKRDKLSFLFEDAEPAALITDGARLREAAGAIEVSTSLRRVVSTDGETSSAGSGRVLGWGDLAAYPAERPPNKSLGSDLAALIYTSGSTGQPKGVMSTHANMLAATLSINAFLGNTPDDVVLNVLPLAFDYGLYQILLAFQVGARVVLEKSFAFPAQVVSVLEKEGVTGLAGVPTLYALLLRYPDLLEKDLPSLRYMTNTAAALPTSHIEQLRAAFPHAQLFSMYGQTECKRVSYLPPEELDRRPASVGIAIPNTEVYIVDDEDKRVAAGEIGELVVRGPHVMQGYWRSPELTAQRYRPGPLPGERVLYTGDLFRMDEDGYLYFMGRKDDIIKCRGEKVSPREVENAACMHDSVAEAAVLGVPDPILGQAIRLLVVPRAGATLTAHEVRAHCARYLEDFMLPKYVELVSELPRTENGKVDKRHLVAVTE